MGLGFCGPQDCTSEDYLEIITYMIETDSYSSLGKYSGRDEEGGSARDGFTADYCVSAEVLHQDDEGAAVMIVVCGLLGAAAVAGSSLENLHQQHQVCVPSSDYELMEKEKINASLPPTPEPSVCVDMVKCLSMI